MAASCDTGEPIRSLSQACFSTAEEENISRSTNLPSIVQGGGGEEERTRRRREERGEGEEGHQDLSPDTRPSRVGTSGRPLLPRGFSALAAGPAGRGGPGGS